MKDVWKVACLSDTHLLENKLEIPDVDVLIHAGDISFKGTIPEISKFCHWYGNLPIKYKVLVAGNHDFLFENDPALARTLCNVSGIIYLENQYIELVDKEISKPLKIYGTPIQPVFCNFAFNVEEEDREEYFNLIPHGLDILITHTPPYGILDEVTRDFKQKWVGDFLLRDRVLEVRPKFHVFGHIHENYGHKKLYNTTYINASNCNKHYQLVNPPIIFEV